MPTSAGDVPGCLEKKFLTNVLRVMLTMQFLESFVLLILGIVLTTDRYVAKGLGAMPSTTGGLVIFVSLGQMFSCTCGRFGARTHNKFCLLTYMGAQLGTMAFIAILVNATARWATDDYDASFQEACAARGRNETCADFLIDEKRTRLRLLWRDLFAETELQLEDARSAKSALEDIQTAGRCCGFDPPYACEYGSGTQSWVNTSFLQGESDAPDQCGLQPYWYFASEECNNQVAWPNGTMYEAGCPFFLPGGSCVHFDFTHGCVYQMRVYLLDRCLPLLDAINSLSIFQVLTSLVSFILFMKRKEHDVLPTTYTKSHRPSKFVVGKPQKVQPR
ncbi:Hypothetical Protein FCC1311_101352 [Hondaea fermentalgiana]|uniref:Uncharacterized protein n=1 Tax=Hondaea fermentalgiana TaxID=2315210 RepID=A0A2R5GSS2_9STRA|nr:Hypothetical Protein FCC1311_101352 [Hondaea fermentalgiana]|eukprot:GBG33912.1 Hypothetical Protein FCC1311_101352 [Hondaea fermentalgiana]